jgi:hypothetical protein
MSSKPITVIDWSQWRSLELIPLSVLSDGDPLTPDLYRPGFLFAGQAQAFEFVLEPGLSYSFSAIVQDPAGQAFLSLGDTGQLLWGNAAALASLGIDPSRESRTVSVDEPTQVVLAIDNVNELTHTTFDFEVRADPPPPADSENIYRFVKLSTGQYFYTASEAERELIASDPAYADFRFEGAVFAGDATQRDGYSPVYRFADLTNGGYFYTASEEERAAMASVETMRYENIAFYVPEAPEESVTLPVMRLKNLDTGGYLFTSNPEEVLYAQLLPDSRWQYQGVAFQALSTLPPEPPPQPEPAPMPELAQDVGALTLVGWVPDLTDAF